MLTKTKVSTTVSYAAWNHARKAYGAFHFLSEAPTGTATTETGLARIIHRKVAAIRQDDSLTVLGAPVYTYADGTLTRATVYVQDFYGTKYALDIGKSISI